MVDPEQAPVIVEMFSRFFSGSGYAEIADHLKPTRRSSLPAPRRHQAQHLPPLVQIDDPLEDAVMVLADSFIAKRIFGPDRLDHFQRQLDALRAEEDDERERVAARLAELEQKIERQLDAIEEGIDPLLVGDRIRTLKTEREEVEAKLAQLDHVRTDSDAIDPDEAVELLASMPDLSAALAEADSETRHALYEAFRLRVEIDRNAGQIRLKALVSSAFSEIKGLGGLSGSAPKAIAGAGYERICATAYRYWSTRAIEPPVGRRIARGTRTR